jgi:D-glycero-alpha-D-manno-heptose-7-phosphate kinase
MIISRTPFRISFFGGGTDYPAWYENHEGIVLNATINKYAYITVRELPPFFDYKYRIQYYLKEEVSSLEDIKHPVVREATKLLNITKGLEIVHNADLPARSGLGSSSTFTVGMFHALYAMKNRMVTKRELALSAINLEQNIIGEAVGSQDQTAAAFGGLNLITFNKQKTFEVQTLTVSQERLNQLQDNLLLCFTGFSRTAEKVAKAQIKATPSKEKELYMMLDILDEAKNTILDQNCSLDNFGELLNKQWHLKRELTNQITNNQIDEIYNKGINAGAIGGKLLGAGGGGFMLFYAKKQHHEEIKKALKDKLFVPFRFEKTGSQIIYYSHD